MLKRLLWKMRIFFVIYAEDDTLWKIFEDMINDFKSIEFDAGTGESHFLKIII